MNNAIICVEKNFGDKGYQIVSPKCISRNQISALKALQKNEKYIEVSQYGGTHYFKQNGYTIIHIVTKDDDVYDERAIRRNPRRKINIIIKGDILPFSNALTHFIEKCCSIARNIRSQSESDKLVVEVPLALLPQSSNWSRRLFIMAIASVIACGAYLYFQEGEVTPQPPDPKLLLSEINKIREHLKLLKIEPSGDNVQDVNRFFSFYSHEEIPTVNKISESRNIDCDFIVYLSQKLPAIPRQFDENSLTYDNLNSSLNALVVYTCGHTSTAPFEEFARVFDFKSYYLQNPKKIKFDGKTGRSAAVYSYIIHFCREDNISNNDKRTAAKYYNLLEKWNVVGITMEDVTTRPYYVIQSFFDFLSLERFVDFPPVLKNVISMKPLLDRSVWNVLHSARLDTAEQRLISLSANGYNRDNNINYIGELYDNYRENPILLDVMKSISDKSKYKDVLELINILTVKK